MASFDYQRIRNDNVCPFCIGEKSNGLIACWPCFRSQDLRNGEGPAEREILINRESMLRNMGRNAD